MFERYTEKARRVIFFARFEATHYGSNFIETEHLLLAILREDGALGPQLAGKIVEVEEIRRRIESRIQRKKSIATNVDVPLTEECHVILKRAATEADRLGSQSIDTGHLLLALLAEEKCVAVAVLKELGIAGPAARERLLRGRKGPAESYLRDSLDALVRAWVERDLDTLLACVGDDAQLIDSSGHVHRGREALRLLIPRTGAGPYDTRRIAFEDVRLVRREVAVATALCDMADASELGGLEQIRAGFVLVRRDSGWEIVSAQFTEVSPPTK